MDKKLQDCYFYFYSTCTKGEHCNFRHESTALGCETMCPYWQQGKCTNHQCSLRHMELKKNRKSIPCYWENQPSGCKKPHCPFMHKNPRNPVGIPHVPINIDVKEGGSGQPTEAAVWSSTPQQLQAAATAYEGHIQVTATTSDPYVAPDGLVVTFQESMRLY